MSNYTLNHLLDLAIRAHHGTSWVPEKRGQQLIKEYSEELDKDLQHIRELMLKNEATEDQITAATEKYKSRYERHLTAYLHSHSNVVSWAIAGPSNFPSARMQKRSQWADNKLKEFFTWRERALKAIARHFKKVVDPLHEAQQKLANVEKLQETMKQVNAAHKAYLTNPNSLHTVNLPEELKTRIIQYKPAYSWEPHPFAPFQLKNNLARIKMYRQRVEELTAKKNKAEGDIPKIPFQGGFVLLNYQADRIQIFFDVKPCRELIERLKKSAFKWAPSQKAWQRQLTTNAKQAVKGVVGVEVPE